ncbi:hypothetical protein K788_0004445 [Paraburkholderia caribensis MBA4]|uniref:Uncharacterized protein n=1 Tax=Paraburkholderia caribensis MBA4 TaxID=1323664 RepID=A0A0P0RAN1_9BURK|nr:hypothetical protein K788_0004445 [Paraburkholderia caribensis MBA4]
MRAVCDGSDEIGAMAARASRNRPKSAGHADMTIRPHATLSGLEL